ncbi:MULTISPECIES: hypothetical protein [Vagococcus]|uniref:Uncharacterized protein n=1 Tax=Vagococcus fluvialis bH819 TaxID=1255619 RepID=A0A1X6WLT6_9ENTE|nr:MULTISPECIES: hypothetical protein [Vagococcus]SLM85230.1 hypothetical protein FM121_03965 [Vagococcus fluvialis bH819]HCM88356.1 hypothetical protein [Vagococcus sp.]
MEKRGYKLKILILCLLCSVIFIPIQVSSENLPTGVVIGDSQGINANKNGEYHVNVANVIPGKNWKTTISILNVEKDIPYQLTMLISPAVVSGSIDLSKEIQMTLTYDGKVVYEGPSSGVTETTNLQTTPLDLGVFNSGDSRALEVEYSLSGKYTNQDFEKKPVMDNVWIYKAVKTKKDITISTDKGKLKGLLPTTGEIKQTMIIFCLGLFFVMTILLIWKKK